MFRRIITSTLTWLGAFGILLLILLLPKDVAYEEGRGGMFISGSYNYTIESHIANIKMLGVHLIEQRGLGTDIGGRSIFLQIVELFSRSMKIVIPAIVIGALIGVAKGIIDFRLKNTKLKVFGQTTSIGLLSIPDLAFIVLIQLGILTFISKGWLFHIDLYGHDKIDNIIMNVLYLSIYPTVYIANVTFQTLQEEEGMDYIRTARSKGIPQMSVIYIHMLKNAMIRILAHMQTMLLFILSNLFIIEVFTQYRGAAYYMANTLGSATEFYVGGLFSSDVIRLIGFVGLFTMLILFANIISEIAKSKLAVQKGGWAE